MHYYLMLVWFDLLIIITINSSFFFRTNQYPVLDLDLVPSTSRDQEVDLAPKASRRKHPEVVPALKRTLSITFESSLYHFRLALYDSFCYFFFLCFFSFDCSFDMNLFSYWVSWVSLIFWQQSDRKLWSWLILMTSLCYFLVCKFFLVHSLKVGLLDFYSHCDSKNTLHLVNNS